MLAAHILGESSTSASIRVRGSASETTPGRVVSSAVMGSRDLDNPAYAQMTSGSIAIDPAQTDRLVALESHWLFEIEPASLASWESDAAELVSGEAIAAWAAAEIERLREEAPSA